jgi:hypothetical protein
MRGVQDFLKDSLPAMIDYITVISSPVDDTSNLAYDANQLDQLDAVDTLYQRSQRMTVLEKESIPVLPHLLDIPKHLAIVKSTIIRNYGSRRKTNDSRDLAVEEFCSVCREVEGEALRRVSRLASKLAESKHPSNLIVPANGAVMEETPLQLLTDHQPSRHRKSFPSTAPSPSDPNSPIDRQMSFGGNSLSPRQATYDDANPCNQMHAQAMHMKAPSTDSTPFGRSSSSVLEPSIDTDPGKRKKGLLKNILRR